MNIGVIPARLHSTRLPEKILLPLGQYPMVVHVYRKVALAKFIDKIIIAVDNKKTLDVIGKYGINGYMTDSRLNSGTDRSAEVVKNLDGEIIVNIQGDEPEIDPKLIDQIISLFNDKNTMMATAATTDLTQEDLDNKNVVKVKVNNLKHAIEFSRDPILGNRVFRHIGIYAYRKKMLENFTKLSQTKNEIDQRLEQMRALDNGITIHTIISNYKGRGIDTIEDYNRLGMKYGT